jgi:hypothetical protein
VKRVLLVLSILLLCSSAVAVGSGLLSFALFTQGKFSAAQATARIGRSATLPVQLVTLRRIPELRMWELSLQLIEEVSLVLAEAHTTPSIPTDISTLLPASQSVAQIEPLLAQSALARRVLPTVMQETMQELAPLIARTPELIEHLSVGTQTWLVLFENNDELRATGGFIGSYALVTLENGALASIAIEDIYDADGQFTGFIAAPPGAYEYLSSGNGLRLPDANWSPDFPTAAQQVLRFFALGEKDGISGVIALNQELVRDLLHITGPLNLPDYPEAVTAETIDSVLRTNRDTFFPGSTQKKHLLTQVFTQLKLRVGELSPTQLLDLGKSGVHRVATKDTQLFATDTRVQEIFDDLRITGRATQTPGVYNQPAVDSSPDFYLFSVESNVGINKANAGVTRQLSLDIQPLVTTITTEWQNQNPPTETSFDAAFFNHSALESSRALTLEHTLTQEKPAPLSTASATHNAYVNYHRLLLAPGSTVRSITFDSKDIPRWDQELITTTAGETLTQVGFLTVTPEQYKATLVVELDTPASVQAKLRDDSPLTLVFQKQSGTGTTPLNISTPSAAYALLLSTDLIFKTAAP